jgi:serine/threonine kinase PknH
VSAGLEVAAARGLIHRELEPGNVFLPDGAPLHALLTDFGIAIPDGRACDLVSVIEGADYRSPEAVRGEPLQAQSNVYSLGCILVECLTGAPPFPYPRPLLTLHAHLVQPPPRVSERASALPPALDQVVATAMAKEAGERFQSPSQMVLALRRALDASAPVAVPAPAPKPAPAQRPAPKPASPERPVPKPARAHTSGPKPARGQTPAPKRERAHKPAHAAHAPRQRRRKRSRQDSSRRLPVLGLALALVATMCGFALGSVNRRDEGGTPATAAAPPPRPDRAGLRHAKYVEDVNAAIARLSARRAAGLKRLSAARHHSSQATAAAALARAYGEARTTIAGTWGSDTSAVTDALRADELAYRRLAAAARRGDARAYRLAARTVKARERALERVLASLGQPA